MRLIDADTLLDNLPDDLPYKGAVKRVLTQVPTVDAVSAVHGHWKFVNDYQSLCTHCNKELWVGHEIEPNYCPNCGAKMDL